MRLKKLALGASVALCAAALTACGAGEATQDAASEITALPTPESGEWAETMRAAAKEGKLTYYSVMLPGINEKLERGFERAYPDVDLEIVRVTGAEIDSRLDAEKKTGADGADIVSNVNYSWLAEAVENGDLIAPTGPEATADRWVNSKVAASSPLLQTTAITALGIGYNTEIVAEPVKGYEDLTKPEFKGKIGLVNNAEQAAAGLYAWMKDQFGEDYWEKLAAQDPVFFDSAVPMQEALVSGEIGVAVWGANSLIEPAKGEGAPVEFVLGDPAWGPQTMTYIPEWSAHPNAAQLLYDFLASDEGQTIVSEGNISVLEEIEGGLGTTETVSVIDLDRVTDPKWYDAQQAEWRKTFGR